CFFFFSSRRRHTRSDRDWSSDVCSSDLGLASLGSELVGKRLELLKQAVPGVSRVAVLWLPGALGERTEKDMRTGTDVASRALGRSEERRVGKERRCRGSAYRRTTAGDAM